jgi:hypothetical protein
MSFRFKDHCFFGGELCLLDSRHLEKNDFRQVSTDMDSRVIGKWCRERNDHWALQVSARLNMINDLFSADSVYHRTCLTYFSGNKPQPLKGESNKTGSGDRPSDQVKLDAFNEVCKWLEHTDNTLLTLAKLTAKSEELMGGIEDVYSEKWLERELQERYGDHLFFACINGRRNVLRFRDMA